MTGSLKENVDELKENVDEAIDKLKQDVEEAIDKLVGENELAHNRETEASSEAKQAQDSARRLKEIY